MAHTRRSGIRCGKLCLCGTAAQSQDAVFAQASCAWTNYGPGFAAQVPGIYKIRYVGQTTLSSAAVRAVGCSRLPTVTCLKHAGWRCLWPAGVWALPRSWIPAALREVAGATDGRCRPQTSLQQTALDPSLGCAQRGLVPPPRPLASFQ